MKHVLVGLGSFVALGVVVVAIDACPAQPAGEGEGEGEGSVGEGEGEGEGSSGEGEGEGEGQVVDGFQLRVLHSVTLPCEQGSFGCGANNTVDVEQIDIVCTLHEGGRDAFVYVQANPTSVDAFADPLFADVHGFVHDNTTNETTEVTATYDYGGQHHNDFFDVTLDSDFRYSHSSLGFGGRACQAPDCVQTLDAQATVLVDGCTESTGATTFRSVPEACVYVNQDGTLPALDPDPFQKCLGDPNP